MKVLRQLGGACLLSGLALTLLTATTLAASPKTPRSFREIVATARLITLADVVANSGGGAYVLRVERVLKGRFPTTLTFQRDDKAVVLQKGSRVVIAQQDPRYLDFRGTTVWIVSADGALSDAGVDGQPGTLASLLAGFSLPATDGPLSTAKSSLPSLAPFVLIVCAGLLAFAPTVARKRRAP